MHPWEKVVQLWRCEIAKNDVFYLLDHWEKIGNIGTFSCRLQTSKERYLSLLQQAWNRYRSTQRCTKFHGWSKCVYFEEKLPTHIAGIGKRRVSSTCVVSQRGDIVGSTGSMLQHFTIAKKTLSWAFLDRSSSGANQWSFTKVKLLLDAVVQSSRVKTDVS